MSPLAEDVDIPPFAVRVCHYVERALVRTVSIQSKRVNRSNLKKAGTYILDVAQVGRNKQ